MARLLLASLVLSALVPSCLASSSSRLAKRQSETVALSALITGPVSYVSYVSGSCTARCAAMVASSSSCTEDQCACAASAQTVTCMNCVLESATTAQSSAVSAGFDSYAQTCVDEGYLDVVPDLTLAATTSSSSVASSSSSSSSSATPTSSAAAATSTAGYAAFSLWVTAVGTAVCTTECSPALNAFDACTATDTCICTTTNFAYGQTCEDCLNLNAEGYWTNANLRQLASLWSDAGDACGIAVTTTVASTATSTTSSSSTSTTTRTTADGSSSSASSQSTTETGIPQQSYYAPTTTASSTTNNAGATGVTAGGSGGTSAGRREISLGGAVGALVVGWAAVALA